MDFEDMKLPQFHDQAICKIQGIEAQRGMKVNEPLIFKFWQMVARLSQNTPMSVSCI